MTEFDALIRAIKQKQTRIRCGARVVESGRFMGIITAHEMDGEVVRRVETLHITGPKPNKREAIRCARHWLEN
jgi:hypothetical protein